MISLGAAKPKISVAITRPQHPSDSITHSDPLIENNRGSAPPIVLLARATGYSRQKIPMRPSRSGDLAETSDGLPDDEDEGGGRSCCCWGHGWGRWWRRRRQPPCTRTDSHCSRCICSLFHPDTYWVLVPASGAERALSETFFEHRQIADCSRLEADGLGDFVHSMAWVI